MTRRVTPRAFALPLVLAVIVIASILVAAVLTRHTGQSVLTQRSIDRSKEHHAFKGLEEAVSAWLTQTSRVADAIDYENGGHAFDIELPSGEKLSVYFEDAQGDVLARFSGLADSDLDDAAATVDNLRRTAHDEAPFFLRTEGPVAISVGSADPKVLRAACLTLLSPVNASALADELESIQASGDVSPDALNAALDAANVPQEERARALRLFTTEPVLYRVWVDAWSPGAREPSVTYKALCLASGGRGGSRTATSVTRNTAFLSWERVLTDTDPRTMPR